MLYKHIHDSTVVLQPRGYLAEPFFCFPVLVRSLVLGTGFCHNVLEILKICRTIRSYNLPIILCKYRRKALQGCLESFTRQIITE